MDGTRPVPPVDSLGTHVASNSTTLGFQEFVTEAIGRRLGLDTDLAVETSYESCVEDLNDVCFVCSLPYVMFERAGLDLAIPVAERSAIDSQVLTLELRDNPELAEEVTVVESLGPSTIQPVAVSRRLPYDLSQAIHHTLVTLADDARLAAVSRRQRWRCSSPSTSAPMTTSGRRSTSARRPDSSSSADERSRRAGGDRRPCRRDLPA
ncbi:hypothetical protein BH23ACT5_BH23ACT5_13090 [soil metagenome]